MAVELEGVGGDREQLALGGEELVLAVLERDRQRPADVLLVLAAVGEGPVGAGRRDVEPVAALDEVLRVEEERRASGSATRGRRPRRRPRCRRRPRPRGCPGSPGPRRRPRTGRCRRRPPRRARGRGRPGRRWRGAGRARAGAERGETENARSAERASLGRSAGAETRARRQKQREAGILPPLARSAKEHRKGTAGARASQSSQRPDTPSDPAFRVHNALCRARIADDGHPPDVPAGRDHDHAGAEPARDVAPGAAPDETARR